MKRIYEVMIANQEGTVRLERGLAANGELAAGCKEGTIARP